jgi:hypothetical protein
MAKIHIVRQGEQLSSVAAENGFGTIDPILNTPENAELRRKRKDPHQLMPGDKVFIPDPDSLTFDVGAGRGHVFVVRIEELVLRLRVSDFFDQPIAGMPGILHLETHDVAVLTDARGILEAPIPRTAQSGALDIAGFTFPLEIGSLDPPEEPSGKWGRFVNLGLWRGTIDDDEDDPELVQLATELFQQGRGEPPSGQDDGSMVAQLESDHDRVG